MGGLGRAVAGIGDANGDGLGDWLIATSRMVVGGGGVGVAQVFHGAVGNIANTPTQTLEHPMAAESFGAALASAGDTNGDGFLDVVVGAPSANNASIHLGGTTGVAASPVRLLVGSVMSADFGGAVAHATPNKRSFERRCVRRSGARQRASRCIG